MSPPNIVLIHCHDLGTYLGCYGAAVDTPNLDRLAADGVRFDRHFVTAPQCSPSRGSLQTGRHPHQHGLLGLAHAGWEIHEDERLLSGCLHDAGYNTHLFGLQHITEYPDRLDYDRVHDEEPLTATASPAVHMTARATSVADDVTSVFEGGDYETPFFASIGFFELHRVEDEGSYGFDEDHYETPAPDTVDPLRFLPDRPGIRSDIAAAQGMLGAIDDAVGRILDALETAGIGEETLVVFTTEHGLAFPRAKGTCYDPGIEAALLCRYPGSIEAGWVVDDLVSNVDVFSTLLDFAEVPIPEGVAGESVASLLLGGPDLESGSAETSIDPAPYEPRDRLFAGMTWHDRYNPTRAVRTHRYKFIRNFWHLPEVYLTTDIYCSDAGQALNEQYYEHERPYVELYDLDTDPSERTNLADDPDYERVRERLDRELCEWMERTDDPLCEGPVVPSDWDEIQPWQDAGR